MFSYACVGQNSDKNHTPPFRLNPVCRSHIDQVIDLITAMFIYFRGLEKFIALFNWESRNL